MHSMHAWAINRFEWDTDKAAANLLKQGVRFGDAQAVLAAVNAKLIDGAAQLKKPVTIWLD